MGPMSSIIIDGVLAFLLLAVIIVCLVVYRRLGTIKSGQAELRELVGQLNTAVVEAQRSVASLKQSAAEVEVKLQEQTRKATIITDELSLITEAGNNLADRIEFGLTNNNDKDQRGKTAKDTKSSKKQQRDILAALREAR
ncbi:DUF6468 domain-containing protein [Kordiimonas aquimaris]|uniref:DUF6468 domain-containing protein n=1 Tax=Kordiimonas aquimaris TaxID=707591 RepID=UPI0021CED4D8|nr:DUF6468 domain-containing protein [Kordiimonas aquimaris]